MELRQLRYFLAVAEQGHFTRAAERLHISQPALSQQIQQLESELGTQLLERGTRVVRLTDSGTVLAYHARRMLQEEAEARLALRELEGLQRGTLAVGVVQTVNAYLIPNVVARFTQAYPNVAVAMEELASDQIERRVKNGQLQLGISFVPSTLAGLEPEPLFDEALVLIVREDHPLHDRDELAVSDLAGEPLVLLSTAFCTRRLWDATAREAGLDPEVVVEMNTVAGILSTVRQTGRATVLPALAIEGEQGQGLVAISLRQPSPRRTVGLLWRRGGYRCTTSQAFVRLLREELANLAPDQLRLEGRPERAALPA